MVHIHSGSAGGGPAARGAAADAPVQFKPLTLRLSPPALERAYWETSPVLRTLDWVGGVFGMLFLCGSSYRRLTYVTARGPQQALLIGWVALMVHSLLCLGALLLCPARYRRMRHAAALVNRGIRQASMVVWMRGMSVDDWRAYLAPAGAPQPFALATLLGMMGLVTVMMQLLNPSALPATAALSLAGTSGFFATARSLACAVTTQPALKQQAHALCRGIQHSRQLLALAAAGAAAGSPPAVCEALPFEYAAGFAGAMATLLTVYVAYWAERALKRLFLLSRPELAGGGGAGGGGGRPGAAWKAVPPPLPMAAHAAVLLGLLLAALMFADAFVLVGGPYSCAAR